MLEKLLENPLATHLAAFFFGILICRLIGRRPVYDKDDDDTDEHENENTVRYRDEL